MLPSIIDPQQTAFLGQRSMVETILLLHFLPRALDLHNSGAAAVSCDIRKAYDTVSRDILQQSMAALGVGQGTRTAQGRTAIQAGSWNDFVQHEVTCLSQRQFVRPSDILRGGTSRMPVGPPPLSFYWPSSLMLFASTRHWYHNRR